MKTGIMTFYCSDNYGALLQAYGLLCEAKKLRGDAEIIPYCPPYLSGRHWFIPYCPCGSFKLFVKIALAGMRRNLMGYKEHNRQRRKMYEFRKKYLSQAEAVYFTPGLKKLDIDQVIVGSDQIWNPEITCGLRSPFFGDLKTNQVKKVIAYAASLGGERLEAKYDKEMSALLEHVDCISIREEVAVPYIEQLSSKKVIAVCDPVFFLPAEKWESIETTTGLSDYILVYGTEKNTAMETYIQQLSKEKNLRIVRLFPMGKEFSSDNEIVRVSDGPSEFLGYVHHADYVVTNSFHATAFSLIFHKSFVTFSHGSRNARLSNLLDKAGLSNRLVQDCVDFSIDDPVDWKITDTYINRMKEEAEKYLEESLLHD